MKASSSFLESASVLSELATLSRDPELTFRPDPALCTRFRNADEIIEGDFDGLDAVTRSVSRKSPIWGYAVSCRRSPKE